jgi:hypothetical protein
VNTREKTEKSEKKLLRILAVSTVPIGVYRLFDFKLNFTKEKSTNFPQKHMVRVGIAGIWSCPIISIIYTPYGYKGAGIWSCPIITSVYTPYVYKGAGIAGI